MDKRSYQPVFDDNARASRYYVQILDDSWGPPEMNFERGCRLAQECKADPQMPMKGGRMGRSVWRSDNRGNQLWRAYQSARPPAAITRTGASFSTSPLAYIFADGSFDLRRHQRIHLEYPWMKFSWA